MFLRSFHLFQLLRLVFYHSLWMSMYHHLLQLFFVLVGLDPLWFRLFYLVDLLAVMLLLHLVILCLVCLIWIRGLLCIQFLEWISSSLLLLLCGLHLLCLCQLLQNLYPIFQKTMFLHLLHLLLEWILLVMELLYHLLDLLFLLEVALILLLVEFLVFLLLLMVRIYKLPCRYLLLPNLHRCQLGLCLDQGWLALFSLYRYQSLSQL